jgi:phosphoglycolate phosphatase-like HAD superfamily hydrolase
MLDAKVKSQKSKVDVTGDGQNFQKRVTSTFVVCPSPSQAGWISCCRDWLSLPAISLLLLLPPNSIIERRRIRIRATSTLLISLFIMSFRKLGRAVILFVVAVVHVEGFLGSRGREMTVTGVGMKSLPSCTHRTSIASTASSSLSSSDTSSTSTAGKSGAVRGIIFDIDGTLADSWNLGFQATLTVLADYHNKNNQQEMHTRETYPLTAEEYHFGCRYTTPERLARHVGLEPDHTLFESVGNDLGKQFDDYYVQLVDKKTAGFYEGIGDLLINLHCGPLSRAEESNFESDMSGVQLGALTNACVEYAHAVLKANCPQYSSDIPASSSDVKDTFVYQRFSSINGANSVPRPKPFGDGIIQCCEEMNLHPSQVIYVGDAPTDARAAVNAQCRAAIGVLWGSNSEECMSKEEGFNILCRNVDELGKAIEQYL